MTDFEKSVIIFKKIRPKFGDKKYKKALELLNNIMSNKGNSRDDIWFIELVDDLIK